MNREAGFLLEKEVEVRQRNPDDVYTILLDPSRTLQDYGAIPSFPLAEGVRRTIEYYRKHGISQTFTHLRMPDGKK